VTAPKVVSRRPAPRNSRREALRAAIRSRPGWVLGLAAPIGVRDAKGESYGPRAFNIAACQNVRLAVSHTQSRLATVDRGTMLIDVDSTGLWFEAFITDMALYRSIAKGGATVSLMATHALVTPRGTVYKHRDGGCVTLLGALHEISIVLPPGKARFASTWVLPGKQGLVRRSLAIPRR